MMNKRKRILGIASLVAVEFFALFLIAGAAAVMTNPLALAALGALFVPLFATLGIPGLFVMASIVAVLAFIAAAMLIRAALKGENFLKVNRGVEGVAQNAAGAAAGDGMRLAVASFAGNDDALVLTGYVPAPASVPADDSAFYGGVVGGGTAREQRP